MILLPYNDSAAAPAGLPKISGHSLLIDFSQSDVLDLSGSGNNLTRNGSAPRLRNVGGRRAKGVTSSAANDGLRGSTTAIIPDTGFVTIWAWYYPVDFKQERVVAGRGQDGSGNGWSVILSVLTNGGVNTSLVTANPGAAQFSASLPAGTVKLHQWNFIALVMQNQYGAEPSFITAYANGGKASKVRTGLTGWSQLRTSTVGFFIDDGLSAGTTFSGNSGIGALGVESNASLTEAQAYDRLYEIERVTSPYFLRALDGALYDPSDQQVFSGTGSASIQKITAAGSGQRGVSGSASATLRPLSASGSGVRGQTGAAAATLPALSASGVGTHGYACAGLATLRPISVTASGVHGVTGAVSATLRAISAAAAGDFTFVGSIEGVGIATLHALTARGVGEHDPGTTDVGGFARPFPGRPGQGISRAIADDRDLLEMLPIVIGVMNHAGR